MSSHAEVKPDKDGYLAENNYLNCEKGLWSWLTTLDHKRIAILYIVSIMIFFVAGGIAALTMRIHLSMPEQAIVSPDLYNALFTLHGVLMIFLFIVPGIPATMGNFLLPLMIGAKDVVFPRLNLFSYYLYVIGAIIGFIAIVNPVWILHYLQGMLLLFHLGLQMLLDIP